MTAYLLDANVLIALTVAEHEHHDRTARWAARIDRIALCPIIEGALVRFMVRIGESTTAATGLLDAMKSLSRGPGYAGRAVPTGGGRTMSSRTLILLRHGKSGYPPDTIDHDRPLAPRGQREAGLAGEWLCTNLSGIDLVLCSTAIRTRQTYERTGLSAPARYVDDLYDATPGKVITTINSVDDDVHTLLVIGHEPAMSGVALMLAGPGTDTTVAQRISMKFPTSGIAVLHTDGNWSALDPGSCALGCFHVPR